MSPPKTLKTGYKQEVYFLRGVDRGWTKVGYSRDVARRVAGLRDSNYAPVELVWSTPGARELERAIHEELHEARHHGEWFEVELSVDDCEELVRAARSKQGATSKTAREVLKSKVWAECEEIMDHHMTDDQAREAWSRGKSCVRDFEKLAKTPAQLKLVETLDHSLEAASDVRLKYMAERGRPGGIPAVPAP